MDSKSPTDQVIPIPNGLNGLWMGVTNHLLNGMIFQGGGIVIYIRSEFNNLARLSWSPYSLSPLELSGILPVGPTMSLTFSRGVP